ncbi:Smr protein/MutS2 [Hyphomicrobium denitrificans ATCC 51888]|uniref:Smr protein/MutS2 n=1 Tax=Hyphomicrobium denitrificans (strain ATCC 51888 / DSM 1869 / NCIMB 11706 / TK 0415) TaxID=582899 RepID=D8JWV0_HYPDA|nr:Smr/MutS family protein [Hyphomicrobium denitrificans]ADJ25058.1 Smr protein/MutS2 [Hyphomicrobium denitrificans ATCC 51888]
MKKPHGKGGRKGHASDEDDDAVWKYAAATIEPLKRAKGRLHVSERATTEPLKAKMAPKQDHAHKSQVLKHDNVKPAPAAPIAPARRVAPDLADFDRKHVRKIRGGRTEIEARVDLHGLRQSEAHAALRAFLFRCQSRGLRFVLVITGKGKPGSASEAGYRNPENERGVLKRNVPRWLEEPDVRTIVVSYTTAAIQHGGEGAIYVHLRARHRV